MDEAIDNAVEELKRVDHSIFVSLKYTRTVDILENILTRMVDCYENLFLALLKYAKDHKMVGDIPATPKERVTLIKDVYKEQEIHDNIDLYLLLKAMIKANFSRENEYRRHVAMRAIIAGREEIININIISRYYEFLTSFFHMVDNLRKGTYVIGSATQIGEQHDADEENPNNPYWTEIRQMKEDAEMEIARDKEIRERIRVEKQQKEIQRQKDFKKIVDKKIKRITRRKPKIKPKRVIPKEKLKYAAAKKPVKKSVKKSKK
ncbi:MAG: hypothetical protein ACP5NV_06285 [Candidatus Woesearchaeota archaeon]